MTGKSERCAHRVMIEFQLTSAEAAQLNRSQIVIGSEEAWPQIKRIFNGSSQISLNHADAFGVADGFEAGVGVEFCEDVFDVIVYGGGADVELIRNRARAVALCQTL